MHAHICLLEWGGRRGGFYSCWSREREAEVCEMLFQLLGSCITRGRERGWMRLGRGHPAVEREQWWLKRYDLPHPPWEDGGEEKV